MGMNLIILAPGQRGRIHDHERQEEVYLVWEGTLTLSSRASPTTSARRARARRARRAPAARQPRARALSRSWLSAPCRGRMSVATAWPGNRGRTRGRRGRRRRCRCPPTCPRPSAAPDRERPRPHHPRAGYQASALRVRCLVSASADAEAAFGRGLHRARAPDCRLLILLAGRHDCAFPRQLDVKVRDFDQGAQEHRGGGRRLARAQRRPGDARADPRTLEWQAAAAARRRPHGRRGRGQVAPSACSTTITRVAYGTGRSISHRDATSSSATCRATTSAACARRSSSGDVAPEVVVESVRRAWPRHGRRDPRHVAVFSALSVGLSIRETSRSPPPGHRRRDRGPPAHARGALRARDHPGANGGNSTRRRPQACFATAPRA